LDDELRVVFDKEGSMITYIPAPDPITPAWLTAVLHASGALTHGEVLAVDSALTSAFNSHTSHLQLHYSNAAPGLTANMILKRNIPGSWGVEAGAQEVTFYQLVAALPAAPPAIVPCYAAAYDPASGDSYLLLHDLSATHAHPITRDQQISITDAVPPAQLIERVIDTLAQHHAYWWDHALLDGGTFEIGYWSRDAERFALYLQRRRTSWEGLLANEAAWFPDDLRELYACVLDHLEQHWQRYLEPRFQARANLTLVHGDAYFANFLCPTDPSAGATYLLDWQSPTVDIGGYDLANLCATFWTSAQRHAAQREQQILRRYHAVLQAHGVRDYTWPNLLTDYQAGLIYWLLVPLQDRYDGAGKDYWWPKMQCLVAAFREWHCADLLGMYTTPQVTTCG
jgi:Ecdysteroid kinase-like family